jgi:hypothetical protein
MNEECMMGIRFLVQPIAQPNWSACWYTAMLMLDRWRRIREGFSLQMSDLENVVYQPKKVAEQSINLFSIADIDQFLLSYRFKSCKIAMTGKAFLWQLQQGKPFAYVADAGNGYQHILVVTGIEQRRDLFRIYYIDPDGGRAKEKEFFAFALEHPQARQKDRDNNIAFIIFPDYLGREEASGSIPAPGD